MGNGNEMGMGITEIIFVWGANFSDCKYISKNDFHCHPEDNTTDWNATHTHTHTHTHNTTQHTHTHTCNPSSSASSFISTVHAAATVINTISPTDAVAP